jgi:hypothetical protein
VADRPGITLLTGPRGGVSLSLSPADMNDGAARAKDRPCRPQKKNPTFCQLEVTRECGILVPVVFLELLFVLLFQIRCVREKLP